VDECEGGIPCHNVTATPHITVDTFEGHLYQGSILDGCDGLAGSPGTFEYLVKVNTCWDGTARLDDLDDIVSITLVLGSSPYILSANLILVVLGSAIASFKPISFNNALYTPWGIPIPTTDLLNSSASLNIPLEMT